MKRNLLVTSLLASGVILTACGENEGEAVNNDAAPGAVAAAPGETAPAAAGDVSAPARLARVNFAVEGMTCGGCVLGTRAALKKLDGVRDADANYDDATGRGTAWALYDPGKTSPERMMAAIRELGYTPTVSQS
jgi:copper chaperone CopZ